MSASLKSEFWLAALWIKIETDTIFVNLRTNAKFTFSNEIEEMKELERNRK